MSARRPIRDKHLSRLPVFPLPDVALFPRTFLPLHVFEPRYRALVDWCLGRRWPLVVARIAPGHERDHLGEPPLSPIAGVGELAHQERLAGGRINVLVRGVARVRLVEELPRTEAFRFVRVELIADRWPADPEPLADLLATAQACLSRLRVQGTPLADALGRAMTARDPAYLSDAVASVVMEAPDERARLLECTDVQQRLQVVVGRLSRLVAESARREGPLQ